MCIATSFVIGIDPIGMCLRIQTWASQIGTENPPAFRKNQNSAFSPAHSRQIIFFSQNLRFLACAGAHTHP
ncbi:hypothetical protein QWA_15879 [Alcaligenes faecalis subsp. faecalis NCIB 8687]|nr:hypothetical protein QWA_15879 [Alcaligenes faecalis subsp. faecalis NCIB 8687]